MIDLFSPDFAAARRRWLTLATGRGLALQSHDHPLRGPAGERLAIDVVRDGRADATQLLLPDHRPTAAANLAALRARTAALGH